MKEKMKKIKKKTNLSLIYIEWCDAVHNAQWFVKDDAFIWAEEGSEWIIKECGYLLKETKEYICLANRYKPADNNTDEQFGGLQKIPKTWIKKRIKINI